MQKVKMVLTNGFHPDVRVYKEAKYLATKGFDVEILCWDRQNEYKNREVEEIDGIKIKRFFPYAKYGTGYRQIISYIKFIKECKDYLRDKECNYLHCHDLDGVIAGYFCMCNNCRLIFDMHEFYEGQGRKQKIWFLIRILVNLMHNRSDFIIYLNEIQKTTMKRRNWDKLIYLPNYPEAQIYANCTKTFSDKLRISYIGTVRQFNELKKLMDACCNIEGVEVSIHGLGNEYQRLKEIENNYNNVNITGLYHYNQSVELYNNTDILYAIYDMNIKNWEHAYPVKFYEAIITKTPIIVSRGSMLEESLKGNDIGFVVDGSNVREIKELVNYINANKCMLDEKVKNIEKIQFDYTWQNVVKNLGNIYDLRKGVIQ